MKRSLFRVGAALATLALAGTLAACSNNNASSNDTKPTVGSSAEADSGAAAPGEDAGFEEQPLGDDVHVGPLVVGGVYFQPVDMEPTMGVPASEASMHMEADIHAAADNKLGYGAGNTVQSGTFMPMNASDGPHYGLNIPKLEAGTYDVTFSIESPEKNGWMLHTDKATGVEGRFWTEPLVAEFPDWQWDPTAVSW